MLSLASRAFLELDIERKQVGVFVVDGQDVGSS